MTMDDETRGFQKGDVALILRFYAYVRPHLRLVLIAVASMAAMSALQVAGPYLVKLGIDRYILPGNWEGLWRIAFLYFAALAGMFVCQYIETMAIGRAGQSICLNIRDDLYARLQLLPMRFYDRNPVGRTVTRLTNDVESLSELVSSGVVAILSDVMLLTAIAAMMFWMNAAITIVAFLLLPILAAITIQFRLRVRESFREIRLKLARLNAFLNERVQGMRVIRAFNAESETAERHAAVNADHYEAHMDSIRLFAVYNPLVDFIGTLSTAVLIWFAAGKILAGRLTFGELVAFLSYLDMFYKPIRDLAEKYNILQAALAAMEKVFGLMDEPVEAAPSAGRRIQRLTGQVAFDHVTFAYDRTMDGAPVDVLRNVSFDIRPGEKVAIVGATGAGKSTVASLIMGFYAPGSGQILLDGEPVQTYDLAKLRRRIGYITQEPFLFSGTLAENVTLGDPSISFDAVRMAADACGLGADTRRFADGLQGKIAERGATYSAGERQLVAFARCLAFDPDLLVLDEATAAIDPATEAKIERVFQEAARGRTAIVIAHRPATIRTCDRILVFHHGRLVESGTHDELIRRSGVYALLVRRQEAA